MAVAPRIEVDGIRELSRALNRVEKGLGKEVRKANLETAEVVAEEARARVPVLSGRLRSTIKARATQRGASVQAGNARVPYAARVHFAKGRKSTPFLFDALAAQRDEAEKAIARHIDRLIDRHF